MFGVNLKHNMEKQRITFEQLPEAIYNLSLELLEIKQLLTQRSTPAPTADNETPLTIQQAADFLNVSRQTIYQNIAKIPHRKRHGRLYFFKTELAEYLNRAV